jgi:serine/threonine-protein kinase RsbT
MGLADQAEAVLARWLSPAMCRSVVRLAARRLGLDPTRLKESDMRSLLHEIKRGIELFVQPADISACAAALDAWAGTQATGPTTTTLVVEGENDVLVVRRAARSMAERQGFGDVGQTRVATMSSELARNIVMYAGHGEVRLSMFDLPHPGVEIMASDRGPGIANLEAILAGRYRSRTGMGSGLRGTKAIADEFKIESAPGKGTTVVARKYR